MRGFSEVIDEMELVDLLLLGGDLFGARVWGMKIKLDWRDSWPHKID